MGATGEFELEHFGGLVERQSLTAFRDGLGPGPAPRELRVIIDRAVRVLTGLYVHLPLKQAAYAVDPLQQLQRLESRIAALDPASADYAEFSRLGFFQEMLAIFNGLHDLHTQYILPGRFRDHVAFLPFVVEEYWPDAGVRSTIVISKVAVDPDSPPELLDLFRDPLVDRVELRHWNGVPIRRWIEREADRNAGANAPASRERALDTLTARWLGTVPVPDEEWIDVSIAAVATDGPERLSTIRTEWRVGRLESPLVDAGCPPPHQALRIALDTDGEQRRALRERTRWITPAAASPATDAAPAGPQGESAPHFRWWIADATAGSEVGYVRIFTFATDDPAAFMQEFLRIVEHELRSPPGGLIIDVRGNPGGNVVAGEMLLEALSPRPIRPALLQFLNTRGALAFVTAEKRPPIATDPAYEDSIRHGLATGSQYSRGLPAQPEGDYNATGQRFDGPVALIVNGRSYSTCDLVAAGFQDNSIGEVIGTAGHTGGGGGIVIDYECLRALLTVPAGDPPEPTPPSAWPGLPPDGGLLQFALQRFARVGKEVTEILEDRGVLIPDELRCPPTRADVFRGNERLIAFAVARLRERAGTRGALRVDVRPGDAPALEVDVRGAATLQLSGPSGPWRTLHPAQTPIEVDLAGFADPWLRIEGYDAAGTLVVSRRTVV